MRLEKEARDMETLADTLRHSQAKAAELEKTNKKLYNQTHMDRKAIVKLKEEVEVLKVKAARADKLQLDMSGLRERAEESSRVQAKLKVEGGGGQGGSSGQGSNGELPCRR